MQFIGLPKQRENSILSELEKHNKGSRNELPLERGYQSSEGG